MPRSFAVGALVVVSAFFSFAQQPSTTRSANTGTSLAARAAQAMTNGAALKDVTLDGSVRIIEGSEDESGTISFKAMMSPDGEFYRADQNLPNGPHSEVRLITNALPSGTWSGEDGKAHSILPHNLMSGSAWFFPAFSVLRLVSGNSYAITANSAEVDDSVSALHLAVAHVVNPAADQLTRLLERLSTYDVYLDPNTLLPSVLSFNTHPDKYPKIDIPVEVHYSDYRTVDGVLIPFRIEKYVNHVLAMDVRVGSASINTGMTTATFVSQ